MDSLPAYQHLLSCPPCADPAHHSLSRQHTAGAMVEWAQCSRTRMAVEVQRRFSLAAVPTAACTVRQRKRRKTQLEKTTNKKKLDGPRGETTVNIGVTIERWSQLMEWKAWRQGCIWRPPNAAHKCGLLFPLFGGCTATILCSLPYLKIICTEERQHCVA